MLMVRSGCSSLAYRGLDDIMGGDLRFWMGGWSVDEVGGHVDIC